MTLLTVYAWSAGAQLPSPKLKLSNLRIKKISLKKDSLELDTLSIVPSSFLIPGTDTSAYRLDFVKAMLHWRTKPQADSITVVYRVFPYRLNSLVQRLSYDSVLSRSYLTPFEFNDGSSTASRGLFDFGNLQYNGSFGRSISFGNSQDAVVNSNFQLQISGMLRDS